MNAPGLELPLFHVAVKLDFLGEIGVKAPLPERVPQTTKEPSHADL